MKTVVIKKISQENVGALQSEFDEKFICVANFGIWDDSFGFPEDSNVKMTGETPEERSNKRKPREDRQNHRYHRYHGSYRYHGSHR